MPGGERSSTLWRCFSRSCRTEEPQFPSPLPPDPTDLLFSGLERLLKGAVQTIYAGKAHPADQGGREISHGNDKVNDGHDRSGGVASLYDKLGRQVIPLFYKERDRLTDVTRHFIVPNGSFFNTHRMVLQYVLKAYFE